MYSDEVIAAQGETQKALEESQKLHKKEESSEKDRLIKQHLLKVPSTGFKLSLPVPFICTGSCRNRATCGTTQEAPMRRFAPIVRAGGWVPHQAAPPQGQAAQPSFNSRPYSKGRVRWRVSNVTKVNRSSAFALRRSTLDFCLGGQRSVEKQRADYGIGLSHFLGKRP